jgi:hypothetical protein
MLPGVAKRVVLHIGAMKSGTSFIQNVLNRNRALLEEHDVRFACEKWRHQVLAVHDLMDHGGPQQPPFDPEGSWRRMVQDIQQWHGTSVVSMEFLAPRQRPKIETIKDAFAGSDLQVVLTARDLARSLPAMWTETMQNRGVKTWEEFLDAVRNPEEGEKVGQWFWRNQRIAAIAERWSEAVGRDHFTLVTVPPKGAPPSVLWDRFASVVGIPEGLCDLDVRSNPGIDAASAMVLRALNERLAADGFDRQDYERVVKGVLAKQGFVRRGRESVPLGIDERWVRRRSRQELDRLRELDLRVVGDLDDLEATSVPGVHTRKVSAEQQLEAALDGLTFMAQRNMKRWADRRAAQQARNPPLDAGDPEDEETQP